MKKNNRTMRLNLRLTEDESTRLRKLAKERGFTVSKYVRWQIFIDRQGEWLKRMQADIQSMRNEIILANRRFMEMDLDFVRDDFMEVLTRAGNRLSELTEVMEKYGSNGIEEHQTGEEGESCGTPEELHSVHSKSQ